MSASQQSIANAWAAALRMQPTDLPLLLRRLAMVFELPDEICAILRQIDEDYFDPDLAMRWEARISASLGPALFSGQQAQQLAGQFDGEALMSLEYCSGVLHRQRPERDINDFDLRQIRELIDDLETAIDDGFRTGWLHGELLEFMTFHVAAMKRALEDLDIRGPAALEDALDKAVGAAYRRIDLTVRADDTSRSVWKKFGNLILGVAAVLQIATSSLALPSQIQQELEGPPPTAPAVQVVINDQPQPGAISVNDGAALPGMDSAASGDSSSLSSPAPGR
jgi:hypothetical protein